MTTNKPRPRGRPKVPDRQSRERGVGINFSRAECDWIDQHRERGQSRRAFLMRCAEEVCAPAVPRDPEAPVRTVGDLRTALAHLPDDQRVVVDGYEDGYSDVWPRWGLAWLGFGGDYEGDHATAPDEEGFDGDTPVRVAVLSRYQGYEDDQIKPDEEVCDD